MVNKLKRVFLAIIVIVIVAVGTGGYLLFQGEDGKEAPPVTTDNEINVHVKLDGLWSGDNVKIVGGRIPENKPDGEYMLKDPFELTLENNGLARLPIENEGTWEIEAAGVNYGEIPEFYRIKVDKGDNLIAEYWVGRTMPLSKASFENVSEGDKIGLIGSYWSIENKATTWMYGTHLFGVGEGEHKEIGCALESDSVHLSAYEGQSVWLKGSLVHKGVDGGPPLLKVTDIEESGKSMREID